MRKNVFNNIRTYVLVLLITLASLFVQHTTAYAASGSTTLLNKVSTATANSPIRYNFSLSKKSDIVFTMKTNERIGSTISVKDPTHDTPIQTVYLSTVSENMQYIKELGIYKNMVADNMAHSMVPQECGAKEEVRWAKVTDRKGRGMLFEMDPENGPMMFSALPYTPHEMENAMHPYELPEVHYTVVRAAKGQMGIGGDDSWGSRTHEEYLLKADEKMTFSFVFKGL